MIRQLSQFEAGMYQEAHNEGHLSFSDYLDQLAAAGDIAPDVLPTREERRQAAGRNITAVQHILAANGVRIRGQASSPAGVFFPQDSNYVEGMDRIFPAYLMEVYDRQLTASDETYFSDDGTDGDLLFPTVIAEGFRDYTRDRGNRVQLSDLIAVTIGIQGDAYKAGYIDYDAEDDLELDRVAEGADLPLYTLVTGERSIRIYKFGGRVRASYEFLRRVQLNKLARTIQGIANKEEIRKIKAAIAVALNGDGNSNPAQNTNSAASTWAATDFDKLEADMNDYDREPAMYVGDKTEVLGIRAMRFPAGTFPLRPDQVAMFGGTYQTPSGVPLRFAPAGSDLDASQKLLTWGREDGLEMVRENGSMIREADRFIRNQTQEFTISENVGFAKADPYGHWTLTRV